MFIYKVWKKMVKSIDKNNSKKKPQLKESKNKKLSVILPCYHEGKHIYKNLCIIDYYIRQIGIDYELIAIDDGSKDNTTQEIVRFRNDYPGVPLQFHSFTSNRGKCQAIKKGFNISNGNYIAFLDSDLDLHPRFIKIFYDYMQGFKVDTVIGSKRHPSSKVHYPLTRRFLSSCYQFMILLGFALPISDSQVGCKLFKRECLDYAFSKSLVKQYAFDVEVLVNIHRAGWKIMEAPIALDFQFSSTVSTKAIKNMFLDTVGIFYRMKTGYYDTHGMQIKKPSFLKLFGKTITTLIKF